MSALSLFRRMDLNPTAVRLHRASLKQAACRREKTRWCIRHWYGPRIFFVESMHQKGIFFKPHGIQFSKLKTVPLLGVILMVDSPLIADDRHQLRHVHLISLIFAPLTPVP